MKRGSVEVVVEAQNILGEGALWSVDEQRLYWTDIEARQLYRLDPETPGVMTWPTPERACSFAFREKGGLLVAFESGLSFFDLSSRREVRIVDVETDLPATRLNDGRCDRQGRFVVGGFDASGKGGSGAYRLDRDLSLHELFRGLSSANSTCFSLDGRTMYYADTPKGAIWAFDYEIEIGTPRDRRVFYDFGDQPGAPDGSAIDSEGCLWNAQWSGSRVVRFTPEGRIDQIIEMPCSNPTSVAFGGHNLDTLFITSARFLLTEDQIRREPLSGALFAVRPGVQGMPETTFRA